MSLRTLAILLCAALALSALACPALAAEEAYYAGFFDAYYHAAPRCALAGTVAPVERREAERQGKLPCPACLDDDTGYGSVKGIVRGGTLVIRVSDAWLADRPAEEMEDNFDHYWSGEYTGREAELLLAEQLHGAKYRELLEQASDKRARASAVARVPDIELPEGALLMNRRHIGAAWFLTYRPADEDRALLEDKGKLTLPLYFTVNTLSVAGDAVNVTAGGLWKAEGLSLKPKKSKNKAALDVTQEDGLSLSVFDETLAHICVLRQPLSQGQRLAGAAVLIDGADSGIRADGYAHGDSAIFCCVLTDAELNALENGASVALELNLDAPAAIEAGFTTAFGAAEDGES